MNFGLLWTEHSRPKPGALVRAASRRVPLQIPCTAGGEPLLNGPLLPRRAFRSISRRAGHPRWCTGCAPDQQKNAPERRNPRRLCGVSSASWKRHAPSGAHITTMKSQLFGSPAGESRRFRGACCAAAGQAPGRGSRARRPQSEADATSPANGAAQSPAGGSPGSRASTQPISASWISSPGPRWASGWFSITTATYWRPLRAVT